MAKITTVAAAIPAQPTYLYIRNPKNQNEILQIQSKEGMVYRCFAVKSKSGTVVTVDNKKSIYVNQDSEVKPVTI